MYFFDKDGQEVGCFNPQKGEIEGPIFAIGDKEELIGVYGVRNV